MIEKQLPLADFNTIIHWVKTVDAGRLKHLLAIAQKALQRLGYRPRIGKAVAGDPGGSDQYDAGSFRDWCARLVPADSGAVNQLVAIEATLRVRLNS